MLQELSLKTGHTLAYFLSHALLIEHVNEKVFTEIMVKEPSTSAQIAIAFRRLRSVMMLSDVSGCYMKKLIFSNV